MTRKIFWENPYLYEVEAAIDKIEIKDGAYHLILNKTIFYPDMSGGQPGDHGTINGMEVLKTYEEDTKLVHIVKDKPLGGRVKLLINSDRRFDLMQQHSGQHLISGVLYRLFALDTIGFHLGEDYTTIDVNSSSLSDDEIERAEILGNKIIQSNFKIKSYFVSEQQARLLPVRKLPSVDENIRVVEIDGFDFSPCGGTHLSNTGELGLIKITKTEKYKGNTRIYFICGQRAVNDYFSRFRATKAIGSSLSSGDSQIVERVDTLFNERNTLLKENRDLKEKLLIYEGDDLLKNANILGDSRIISKIFTNLDFKELSYLSSWMIGNNEKLVEIFGIDGSSISQFLISKSKDIDLDLKYIYDEIASVFQVKGGGNSNTVQGSVSTDDLPQLLEKSMSLVIAGLSKK